VPLEAFVAVKMQSSEFLWQAADRLVQILGSRGYDEANVAPQILRDARVFRIFDPLLRREIEPSPRNEPAERPTTALMTS
jgi:alkylation response protein AidB-like acyl-CoA dehydrogenase